MRQQLLREIQYVVATKLWNIQRKTATEREIQTVKECLGFLSILNYSCLSDKDIQRAWNASNLKFQ